MRKYDADPYHGTLNILESDSRTFQWWQHYALMLKLSLPVKS